MCFTFVRVNGEIKTKLKREIVIYLTSAESNTLPHTTAVHERREAEFGQAIEGGKVTFHMC